MFQEENSDGNVLVKREGKRVSLEAGNPDRRPLQYSRRKMRGVETRTEGVAKHGALKRQVATGSDPSD